MVLVVATREQILELEHRQVELVLQLEDHKRLLVLQVIHQMLVLALAVLVVVVLVAVATMAAVVVGHRVLVFMAEAVVLDILTQPTCYLVKDLCIVLDVLKVLLMVFILLRLMELLH